MMNLKLDNFPLKTFDKIRYADTDRQGHVNNAMFATYLETGRVEMLFSPEAALLTENAGFVIASLKVEFLHEVIWPGQVEIGTGILKIGNSSIKLFQQLFQNEACVARSESVIVQVDAAGRSMPLTEHARASLARFLLRQTEDEG